MDELSKQFEAFALVAEKSHEYTYKLICQGVARNPELLTLVRRSPQGQRRPNILLAAVHFLLLRGVDHPLASWYGTVIQWRRDQLQTVPGIVELDNTCRTDPYPIFVDFCHSFQDDIEHLVSTRSTQTNEVGRCSALLLALNHVASQVHRPLGLIDLGTSAGLHLLFDQFSYSYNGSELIDIPGSSVHLDCSLRKGVLPKISLPCVPYRTGIDSNPVHLENDDDLIWLLACMWPDNLARFKRLQSAVSIFKSQAKAPHIVKGDAVSEIEFLAAEVPSDVHLTFFHCWMAAYLSIEQQRQLSENIISISHSRPVSWIYSELESETTGLPVITNHVDRVSRSSTVLNLITASEGRTNVELLAEMHPHGNWIAWHAC